MKVSDLEGKADLRLFGGARLEDCPEVLAEPYMPGGEVWVASNGDQTAAFAGPDWMQSTFGPPDSFAAIAGFTYRAWKLEATR